MNFKGIIIVMEKDLEKKSINQENKLINYRDLNQGQDQNQKIRIQNLQRE